MIELKDAAITHGCGRCKHWHEKPDNVIPRNGECRAMPPQLLPMRPGQAGAFFPVIPANSPTCGMFATQIES